MKRMVTPLAIAALLAGASLPVTAQVVDREDNAQVNGDEENTSTMPGADTAPGTGTGAAYEGIGTWGDVVSLLQTGEGTPDDLDWVSSESDVEVAELTGLAGDPETQTEVLDDALSYRGDDISDLRDRIEDHGTISDALDEAGHDAGEVIAALGEVGGPLHVVVDDRDDDNDSDEDDDNDDNDDNEDSDD
ncbi:MAG: hypothetical protein ACLFP0_10595 [Rhodosalinus sp.]